uniref:Uncharacterized protein LOC104229885 n=1 Tax=Nicotiana sylvestris TaxID=4096 RepID=A0A1U7WLR7_NICSY|nr:PREDICTED: uncharacterized protein LOC104229885 [Nicotiana sylvestris]
MKMLEELTKQIESGEKEDPDSFVKAHAGAIKVETRKLDLFKVRKKDNKMLQEFVSRFQMERTDLSPVADDWAIQAFTQGLDIRSSVASQQLKPDDRIKRDIDQEPRCKKDRYQPYSRDRRSNGSGRNPVRNKRRSDQGQSSRGLMSKNGFDKPIGPKEAPQLSEYNFNVDAAAIVSATECIKDTRWPRPLQTDPARRDPNQMCKYNVTHGHRMEDCLKLREGVAWLFNNMHLLEFLSDRANNHFRNRDSSKQNEQEEP